ncbi:MAG: terminase large subunit [Bacteroidales bacterium]|nr:terminase large subunit [Bacteroidales bacterium]
MKKKITAKAVRDALKSSGLQSDLSEAELRKLEALTSDAVQKADSEKATSNHVTRSLKYARDVTSGKITACKWVKLACQRQLDDLAREKSTDWPYQFDKSRAERVCNFIENLPHIKGKWAGSLVKLEPWQEFVLTTVFGWVRKVDGVRRFREMYLEVPRKNAKSTIAAGIGLYMLTEDGEPGAEVYSGATTEKQAWEVFRPARLMAKKADGFSEYYGVEVNASNLHVLDNAARFEPLVGDPGDGAGPHCAIVDEFHEHKTPVQYDAMITGMGARVQPLMVVITTAGSNLAGPCYDKRDQICKTLQRLEGFENEDIFGIIYTIDDEDDWADFKNWIKANPNFGISVFEDFLRARHREAIQRASKQNINRCKHLNQWMNADVAYFDMLALRKCADMNLKIEQFAGKPCYLALDLASKIDVAELVCLFRYENERGQEEYAVFAKHYLPEDEADGDDKVHYSSWAKEGWLTLTSGNIIDYEYIKGDMRDLKSQFEVVEVPYDPYQATQLAVEMSGEGFPMIEYGATVSNFSEPMKNLDAMIRAGRFHYNGDPMLTWMFSNVVAHVDRKDNVFPRKERNENKIDGVVAIIMAMARAMMPPDSNNVGISIW